MYSYEEALQESVKYFNGDELAASVFFKYALRDDKDNLLESNPEQMHRRLAKEFARIEAKKFKDHFSEDFIFSLLDRFQYIIAQGSPMAGIGNPYQVVSLSNCFVAESPLDSYSSILKTDEQLVQISKRRGGVGIDISNLRPAGSLTKNSSRTSTGIVPFMERFSNSIREVGQGNRRGALMLTISIHHPEVLDFAKIKRDKGKVTGANISIRLSDEFLTAVKQNKDYEQRFPVDSKTPIISKMVPARKVWKEIIENAWFMAEPGLLFWDNIIRNSPADCYSDVGFKTEATNPCAELPLCPFDSCRLLLQNLYSYVVNPFTKDASFDWCLYKRHCEIAQRLMDDLIDLELESIDKIIAKVKADPEPEDVKDRELSLWNSIRQKCEQGRRTGTGTTAVADMLAALGLKYGSDKANDFVEQVYETMKFSCYGSSIEMAKELGPFPIFDYNKEKDNEFLKSIYEKFPEMAIYGRRNIALLTTAPAGSVSAEAQTSSGMEPLFLPSYTRRKKINHSDSSTSRVDFRDQSGDTWQEFEVYHPKVKVWMEVTGETDVKKSPWYGCCAEDINWKKRVELQGRITKHLDHAVSSTLNLPEDVSVDKVREIYETAWESGCKGITIYRKNCRTGVLVEKKTVAESYNKRPKELLAHIYHYKIKSKDFFVAIGIKDAKPYELFAGENSKIPKDVKEAKIVKLSRGHYKILLSQDEVLIKDTCKILNTEESALTRLISLPLRHDVSVSFVVEQLEKVEGDLHSLAKCCARALKSYLIDGTIVHGNSCESCKADSLVRENGCITCKSCGWSKCG